jgi:hypothetical protein
VAPESRIHRKGVGPNGSHLTCFEKGDLPIRLKSGRQATLTDVHIVSGSDVNLLSARVLARKGLFKTGQVRSIGNGEGHLRFKRSDVGQVLTVRSDEQTCTLSQDQM